MEPRPSLAKSLWPYRLAMATTAATLVLVFVGGVVTNTGSALAVPDWPTTFGHNMFLYPWSEMVGGILYEHGHRLLGSLVGVLTLAFAASLWVGEPRRWVRTLGAVAVGAVIVQGVFGGLRVVLLDYKIAMIHACFAQAFFALMVGLSVITSPWWIAAGDAPVLASARQLRPMAMVTAALAYLQLIFGAILTHTGTRLDAHLLGAFLVTVAVTVLGIRVLRSAGERPDVRRPALALKGFIAVQLVLGLGAFTWKYTAAGANFSGQLGLTIVTTHRLVGTLIWGTAIFLALRLARLTFLNAHVSETGATRQQSARGILQSDRGQAAVA